MFNVDIRFLPVVRGSWFGYRHSIEVVVTAEGVTVRRRFRYFSALFLRMELKRQIRIAKRTIRASLKVKDT
jgi:hypothetical protein